MVVRYPLKGVFKVTANGHTYWYAWRGPPLGPRLSGLPGSPEFHASYVEAHAALHTPDPGRFRSLVVAYRESSDYQTLSASTRQVWAPWLIASTRTLAICASCSSSGRSRSGRSSSAGAAGGGQTAHGGLLHPGSLASLSRHGHARKARREPVRGNQNALPGRSFGTHLDRDRHRQAEADLFARNRACSRSGGNHGPSAWRPRPAVVVAYRGGRDRHHHRQEPA